MLQQTDSRLEPKHRDETASYTFQQTVSALTQLSDSYIHSVYSESGLGVAPWLPAPPGDRHWQTLTFSVTLT